MQREPQKSVLIIDDEEDFAQTLAERLSLRNLAVQVACSGAEGLERIAQNLPDAVLLDMRMPAMSGIEVLRTVRQQYGMLPVLATVVIPSFLHAYLDLFSGAIQAYVFCMLSMTFIYQKMPE